MSEDFKPKSAGWVMKHFGIKRGKLDKYDELIKPKTRSDQQFNTNKYREYHYEDIVKIWQIHMLSQTDMEMKEIKEIWQSDEATFRQVIVQRIDYLESEKRRIEGLIGVAKMSRATGRVPLPKDFVTVSFDNYLEEVLRLWNSDSCSEMKTMMELADSRLEALQSGRDSFDVPISLAEFNTVISHILPEFDETSVLECIDLMQQLADLFPLDFTSKTVTDIVKQYCTLCVKMSGRTDIPINQLAGHMASQFFDGDSSVELIQKYGKECQEYIASAFEYFAEKIH